MEGRESEKSTDVVSVIVPVHNGEKFMAECLNSVLRQTFPSDQIELSIFNDSSTDLTVRIVESYSEKFRKAGIRLVLGGHGGKPVGCGAAKNRAIAQSTGRFLCFLDADDVMEPRRIAAQYSAALLKPNAIIGSGFHREPPESMKRFTEWANTLKDELLEVQIYTSHGPTIVMPTWFCSREVFDRVGGFDEGGRGTPEDLIFFYAHLDKGGSIARVNEDLLMYRYHEDCTTFSIKEEIIWDIRCRHLFRNVLDKWASFTIWNGGKQGRRFFRGLSKADQKKVVAFCDVSAKLLTKGKYIHEESYEMPKPQVPIVHFSQAKPPMVICMKIDLTQGEFERNLAAMNMREGIDFVMFA